MKLKNKELKVFYFGYDPKMDKAIDRLLESDGYEFVGRGFDLQTKVRDLAYERKR